MHLEIQINDTPENKNKLFELLAKCFPDYWAPRVAAGTAKLSDDVVSVIAHEDGQIFGHCGIKLFDIKVRGDNFKAAGLCAVAVDPQCRGMGIAGKMCNKVLEYCREEGIFYGPLYTGLPKVYSRLGWEVYDLPMPLKSGSGKAVVPESSCCDLDEQQKKRIVDLYENGFSFDGKHVRNECSWDSLFAREDCIWYFAQNAYALFIRDGEDFILCEAYASENNWKNLADEISAADFSFIIYLPQNHPLGLLLADKTTLEECSKDIWHGEFAMINLLDLDHEYCQALSNIIKDKKIFFPLADKF